MKPKRFTLTLFLFVIFFGCQTKEQLHSGEGFVNVKGGKVWYQLTGQGKQIPLVMLHGGPGSPSYYLNPLKSLSQQRPVLLYDQLGCGRSDRITDTSLMTVDHYVEQQRQLLSALKIKKFYLYGHSWGSMLALDYYLKYPDGIKAMILASPCINISLWSSDADSLIALLPDSIQVYLKKSGKIDKADAIKYEEAVNFYFRNYYTRNGPKTADIDSMIAQFGYKVYHYMWGPEEFNVTGTLKDYDKTAYLEKIKVPVLYLTGEYDAACPSTVDYYRRKTPGSKLVVIPDAGHVSMQDNPVQNRKAIEDFLEQVEQHPTTH